MKNYIIGRIIMVAAFFICVSVFFLCIDGIEQSRIAAQMAQIKDNTSGNVTHCRTLTVEGDWIYFIPGSGYGYLYKVKLDGSERQKLVDKKIGEFFLYENKIYYPWRDYDEETDESAEFGFIFSINTDGSDERQLKQVQYYVIHLNVADGRMYYLTPRYVDGIARRNIHSIALDGSDERIHNNETSYTAWFEVVDDIIYYMTYGRRLCSVKTDGSDLTLISGDLQISMPNDVRNINIFGDTMYLFGRYSLKLDGSSLVKEVKSDGTDIADGRIYYGVLRDSYETEKTEEYPYGFCDEWAVCSAKINARGKYEDEKVLFTETKESTYIIDGNSHLIYIIGDRLYFRSREPNRSLYSMDLDGGDLWKIE